MALASGNEAIFGSTLMPSLNHVLLHLAPPQLWASLQSCQFLATEATPAESTPSSVTTAAAPAPRLHKDTSSRTPEGFVSHLPETLIFTLSLSTRITQGQGSPGRERSASTKRHQAEPPMTSPDLPNMAAGRARLPALISTVAIAPRFRCALRQGRTAGKEAVAGPVPPWTGGRSRWTWPRPR